LAENEDGTADELVKANEVEKPNSTVVPEYKANPLL
jgi:hypothetical protein